MQCAKTNPEDAQGHSMNRNPADKKLGLKPAAIDGLMRQRRSGQGKREVSTKKTLYEASPGRHSSVDTLSPVYSAFLSGQVVRGVSKLYYE
jgi:hypothetical protein